MLQNNEFYNTVIETAVQVIEIETVSNNVNEFLTLDCYFKDVLL